MRLFKIISVILICFTLFACPKHDLEKPDLTIYIKNYSEVPVYFHVKGYPDLYDFPPHSKYVIAPKKKFNLSEPFKVWLSDGSKIYFWIFKKSTIEKYNWQEIKANNLYDKKYSFTLKELEAINYTIVYDGK